MYISSVSAIALAIGAAMAQTAGLDPITAPPQGPITIPAGSPYKIEWEKTECALISLQLLAGADPSTLEIQSPPIANMTENTGSFVWHVSKNLEVADTYGIILTVQSGNKTGDFQYSFPFHISGLSTRHHSGRKRPHY